MTPSSDDPDVKRRLDDRTADAVLSGHAVDTEPELAEFVLALRAVASTAPAPSAALAALLDAGFVGAAAPVAARSTTWTRAVTWARARRLALPLQVGLSAAACAALLLGGAATDSLPDPVQTAVADVVEAVTPLRVPRPEAPAPAVVPVTTDDDATAGDPADGAPTKARQDEQTDDHQGRQGSGGERSSGRDDHADGRNGNADDGSTNRDDRSGNSDGRSGSDDGRSGSGDDHGSTSPTTTDRSASDDRSGSGSHDSSTTSGSSGSGSSGSGSSGESGSGGGSDVSDDSHSDSGH